MTRTLTLTRPDDWHLHLRDGDAMRAVLADTAQRFGRAIVMPNLTPPVRTVAEARGYRERILAAVPAGLDFEPLMTLYLTDSTLPDEIVRAKASGLIHAVKYYPAGATTNSQSGVTDLAHCDAVFEAMQETGLPLLVHGEVTDPRIDIFDREAVFIERHLRRIIERFPGLKVVFEHLTTREGVDFVCEARAGVAATLTAHHLLLNRNALFTGGLRPHAYCLPVLKRESHREALVVGRHLGQSAVLPWHRQRAASAQREGISLWLRRNLHGACGDRTVCRSIRSGRRAGETGRLCQLPRRRLLRTAAQHRKNHPGAGRLDCAG